MGASNFDELLVHVGHDVRVHEYINKKDGEIVNVAVECMDCHTVLFDYDKYDYVNKYIPVIDDGSRYDDEGFPYQDYEQEEKIEEYYDEQLTIKI